MTAEIMIIGGGIGGLCLAQGLHSAGVPVTVYERTEARTDWLQGYRIHINPHGSRALHDCLPPPAWQRFLDTVSMSGGGFGFITEGLRDLLRFAGDEILPDASPADSHYGVSRISLREALLTGLDDVVRPGKEFLRYAPAPDGRVRAFFADGTTATADVLIGADGANSRVRAQLLPHAKRIDTGIVAIAGKHRLPADLPRVLTEDTNVVIPSRRGSLFTSVWQPDHAPVPAGAPPSFLLDNASPFALWGFTETAAALPADTLSLDGPALRDLVLTRIATWSPALRDLIAGSDPATVNAIRVQSSTPLTAWQTGPVTLLGDAIHSMTPMAGIGANTALRDADLLRRALTSPTAPLLPALHSYEKQMLNYGFAAVRRSLRNAHTSTSSHRFGRAAFRAALRTVAATPPLKRRALLTLGN
jgi:2-polyprenyl-6-methoxyphenol hydroxylase-like FAD-dependent oxidoreductase